MVSSALRLLVLTDRLLLVGAGLLVLSNRLLGDSLVGWCRLRLGDQDSISSLDRLGVTSCFAMAMNDNRVGDEANEEQEAKHRHVSFCSLVLISKYLQFCGGKARSSCSYYTNILVIVVVVVRIVAAAASAAAAATTATAATAVAAATGGFRAFVVGLGGERKDAAGHDSTGGHGAEPQDVEIDVEDKNGPVVECTGGASVC